MQTVSRLLLQSPDLIEVVHEAGGSLETCVDQGVSSRNSRRPTVPNSMGSQDERWECALGPIFDPTRFRRIRASTKAREGRLPLVPWVRVCA